MSATTIISAAAAPAVFEAAYNVKKIRSNRDNVVDTFSFGVVVVVVFDRVILL